MTFADFLHWLTTSRYTRSLERENAELRRQVKDMKQENDALIFALGRPRIVRADEVEQIETDAPGVAAKPMPRGRRKWVGFSQRKRQMESLEAATPKGA